MENEIIIILWTFLIISSLKRKISLTLLNVYPSDKHGQNCQNYPTKIIFFLTSTAKSLFQIKPQKPFKINSHFLRKNILNI